MSNEHYKIVVAGYNCYDMIPKCLDSIWNQSYRDFDVCVVDDASTDPRQVPYLADYCAKRGWKFLQREVNGGACQAQYEAIQMLDPQDGDVLVWVDLDDALADWSSLQTLDFYYDDLTTMTYGNYRSVPYAATCSPPTPYPSLCVDNNDYRSIYKWGLRFNHLRTVRWDLFKHLDPEVDFKRDGKWLKVSMDMAVMIPCLELSGGRWKFISEVLYEYTSNNPLSEWRKAAMETNKTHDYLASLPRKQPVWSDELRLTLQNSNLDKMSRAAVPPPIQEDIASEDVSG